MAKAKLSEEVILGIITEGLKKGTNGREDLFVGLLKTINVNSTVANGEGSLPLILHYCSAVDPLNYEILKTFAEEGCNLNVQDSTGKSPLHFVVDKGQFMINIK